MNFRFQKRLSILLAAAAFAPGTTQAQEGAHQWSASFGSAVAESVAAIATDESGNAVLVGNFSDTIDFGGGPLTSAGGSDVFVAQLDRNGEHLWSQSFGDSSEQTVSSVAIDSQGNIAITGQFSGAVDFGGVPLISAGGSDVFFASFTNSGSHRMSQGFGDSSLQTSSAVAIGNNDNVVLVGQFEGTIDFGGGPITSGGSTDIFLVMLNSSGVHLWSQGFGDSAEQTASAVATDPNGNLAITGQFEGTVDFGSGPVMSNGLGDVFLASYTSAGSSRWTLAAGDGSDQISAALTADNNGNFYLAGNFEGAVDFGGGALVSAGGLDIFLSCIGDDGGHLWSQSFGDLDTEEARAITISEKETVLLGGSYQGSVNFGGGVQTSAGTTDAFVVEFTSSGSYMWSQSFGDSQQQTTTCLAATSLGSALIGGEFEGSIDLGGGPMASSGAFDIFVASLVIDPLIFTDGFESGDLSGWSSPD